MQLAIYFHLKDHKFSPTSYIVEGRGDFCVKRAKVPRVSYSWEGIMQALPTVTHGKDLCKTHHQSLMVRNYASPNLHKILTCRLSQGKDLYKTQKE